MTAYKVVELGAPETWSAFEGPTSSGKRFAEFELETQYTGLSSNGAAPGKSSPYWHTHAQEEELYIFLAGKGQMAVNDDVVDVEAGTVVLVSPGSWSAWRSLPDSTEELRFIVTRAGGSEKQRIGHDVTVDKERPFPWA